MLEVLQITNPKAARAFANARQRYLVLTLIVREQSLQQISQISGLSLSLLHHHVTQLQKLGLLDVVKTSPRSGRSIKYYRAVARAFFVPAALLPPREELMMALRAGLDRCKRMEENAGIRYSIDGDGKARMERIAGKGSQLAMEHWLSLRLSKAEAASLASEVTSLAAHYREKSAGRGRHYLIYFALAPTDLLPAKMRIGRDHAIDTKSPDQ